MERSRRMPLPQHVTCWSGCHLTSVCGADPTFLRERARHQSAWHPTWPPSIRPGTVGGDQALLERIPAVQDVQSVWALILHCAGSRANYSFGVSMIDTIEGCGQCLARILGRNSEWDITTQEVASSFVPRRAGFAECCLDKSFSILGKLVRFTAHDQNPAPRGGRLMHQDPERQANSEVFPGLIHHLGKIWQTGHDHHSMIWTTKNQVWCVMGGNTRQLQEWSETFTSAG